MREGEGRGERQRIWSGCRSGLNKFSKFSRFDGFRGSRVLGLGINLLEVGISRFRLLVFFFRFEFSRFKLWRLGLSSKAHAVSVLAVGVRVSSVQVN